MVTKTQIHPRISTLHKAMLEQLCDEWGFNEGEAIGLLIDRARREDRRAHGRSPYHTPLHPDDGSLPAPPE